MAQVRDVGAPDGVEIALAALVDEPAPLAAHDLGILVTQLPIEDVPVGIAVSFHARKLRRVRLSAPPLFSFQSEDSRCLRSDVRCSCSAPVCCSPLLPPALRAMSCAALPPSPPRLNGNGNRSSGPSPPPTRCAPTCDDCRRIRTTSGRRTTRTMPNGYSR